MDFFPTAKSEQENWLICASDAGLRSPFSCMMTRRIPDMHLCASTDAFQCFPLFTYSHDGKERRDNIPLFALQHFQKHYKDKAINREDIFYYVYALLHYPDYRARYSENLKRELPRIPLAGKGSDFHSFAKVGRKLADLHVNYERQKAFPLKHVENPEMPLDWRVEAMKLSKDHTAVHYNDFLTLVGVPHEAFDYRLGNRSALEWVIDQYRVHRDEQGNITSDPNRSDDEQYIVRLLGQVIAVSLETNEIIAGLPPLAL